MSGAQLPLQPVVDPQENAGSMTDRICALVLRERAFLWWWLALLPAAALLAFGVVGVGWLFYAGVGVWGIDWPVAWGYAIINYVWWIAIASGGTFISSLFFLVRVEWRTSLNRIAETMTLCAAACAGIYPILHLGRPWLFYWLFPYPNTMTLWPQFRSPLLWDFFAIMTYVISSILFWYLGLIPDLASVRDRARTRGKQLFYGALALGFRGSGTQWRHYRAVYGVLAAIMAPLVVSVHSIVGLDFAGGLTVGWHSTQFPPLFVFGALLSGFATVILLVLPLRRLMRLESFITGRHLDVLGKLLLTSSLCLGYGYIMDAFSMFYGPDAADKAMFVERISGLYAYVYWGTILFNITLPQLLWFRRLRMNQPLVMLISAGVIVGMWYERFEIVVTSLHRTHLPSAWGNFHGTFWDWSVMLGTVGLFFTAFLLLIRLMPIISMFEMRELLRGENMILAGFLDESSLMHAAARLREAAIGKVETYTPAEPRSSEGERRTSPLPAVILAAGVLGAAGTFLMQSYATTWSYPIDVGGRPDWSWPADIPTTFEMGALAAVAAGFFGFLIANRLPHLYDPIDESDSFRQASRDGFFLAVRPRDDTGRRRARELLDALAPASLEELGA